MLFNSDGKLINQLLEFRLNLALDLTVQYEFSELSHYHHHQLDQ